MKKLILLTIILLTPLFAQASTCEDDERLQDKRSLVKAVRSGEGISPKITITFETFFNLHPKMRGIIGGGEGDPNFNVVNHNCKTMDLANGQSYVKHQTSFDAIKLKLAELQKEGNQERLEFFINNVDAAPMKTQDILDLLDISPEQIYSRNTICTIQNAGKVKIGMSKMAKNGQNVRFRGYKVNNCDDVESTVMAPNQIDLYAGFGGKFLEKDVVIDSGYYRELKGYGTSYKAGSYHYVQASYVDNESGDRKSAMFEKKVNRNQHHIRDNQHILNIVAPYMDAEVNTPTFGQHFSYNWRNENIYDNGPLEYDRFVKAAKTRHQAINANAQVASTSSNQCQDDERLQNLHDLIGVAQIQDQITPLVKMSYHTYLNMDQEVRSMIAGGDDALNLDLFDDNCNSIMLIDGAPIDNIEMSFNNIYKTILGYQEKGDLESIATLYKTVKAKPESIEKIMDWVLNVNPDIFETPTTCYLQELGAVRVGLAKYDSDTPIANACDGVTIANQPSKIDLFAAFGGKVAERGVELSLWHAGEELLYFKLPNNHYNNKARHRVSFILQGSYIDSTGLSKPIMKTSWFKRDWYGMHSKGLYGNYAMKDNLMALRVRSTELNVDLKVDGWLNGLYEKQSTKEHYARVVEYEEQLKAHLESKVEIEEEEAQNNQVELEGGDLEAEELE